MVRKKRIWLLLVIALILLHLQGCKQNDVENSLSPPSSSGGNHWENPSLASDKGEADSGNMVSSDPDTQSASHAVEGDHGKTGSASSKTDEKEPAGSGSTSTEVPRKEDSSSSSSKLDSSSSSVAQPTPSPSRDTSSAPSSLPADEETSSASSETVSIPNNVEEPTFVVESVKAKKGSKRVPVKIKIQNNPGISSIALIVSYDSSLELESIDYNSDIGGQTMLPEKINNPLKIIWVSPLEDMMEDALFATVYFNVDEALPEDFYQISLSYNPDDVYNLSEQNISFIIKDGGITVTK